MEEPLSTGGEYHLKMSTPAYITIVAPGGQSVRLDLFEAARFLDNAAKQPTEDKRWEAVSKWLEGKLGVKDYQVTHNMAFEFHQATILAYNNEQALISKNIKSTVCLRQPIPASPMDTPVGQSN